MTPELSETLVVPEQTPILELDELWSFVLKKANKRWIWIALCRETRQVVAYQIGDRSQATCQKLREKIPEAFRTGHCFSDFWEAYQLVIPPEQHTAVGKESGETAHFRTLEQYFAAASGAICSENLVVFKERCDARDMFAFISASL